MEGHIIQVGNYGSLRERKGMHLHLNLTFYLEFFQCSAMNYVMHKRGKHGDKYFDLDEISSIIIEYFRYKALQ